MPVFHLDIEAFMTSVEQLKNPPLRRRPLVIAPPRDRATVIAASPRAKHLGIVREMPLSFVQRHFPDVCVIEPDYSLYDRAGRYVLGIVSDYSPIVEPIGYGHVAMDMTGMSKLFGNLENAALKLTREIRDRARLPATVGIAANKLVSTIAAKQVQREQEPLHHVRLGDESHYLSPLPCRALPEWQEKEIRRLLFELNLKTIGQIQAIPRDIFSFAVGAIGVDLYRHALGIDPQPVTPPDSRQRLTREHRFFPDTNDDPTIQAAIYSLIEALCFQLRAGEQSCDQVRIKLQYSDDVVRKRFYRLPPTNQEQEINKTVLQYYEKLCDRRQRVRCIRVSLGGISARSHQPTLFQAATDNRIAPHLDKIRKRFGKAVIQYGRGVKAAGTGSGAA